MSFVYVPIENGTRPNPVARVSAGAWEHTRPPASIPSWIKRDGWFGTIAIPLPDGPGQVELVNRAVDPVVVGGNAVGYVVGDLPIARAPGEGAASLKRL